MVISSNSLSSPLFFLSRSPEPDHVAAAKALAVTTRSPEKQELAAEEIILLSESGKTQDGGHNTDPQQAAPSSSLGAKIGSFIKGICLNCLEIVRLAGGNARTFDAADEACQELSKLTRRKAGKED